MRHTFSIKDKDPVMEELIARLDIRRTVLWAIDCAEHHLDYFNGSKEKNILEKAIAAGKMWVQGKVPLSEARAKAFAANEVARTVEEKLDIALARSCGHAVETAYWKDHAIYAANYAVWACYLKKKDTKKIKQERDWQIDRLRKYISKMR